MERRISMTPSRSPLRLVLVGDIMIGRLFNDLFSKQRTSDYSFVQSLVSDRSKHHSTPPGYDYVWGDLHSSKALQPEIECIVGNLETSITKHPVKYPGKVFNFRSFPEHAIPMLKALGVRHVSLANNHILDYSTQGMADTCAHLDKAEISHCGCGPDLSAAMQMSELTPQPGWKLGFLSAADHEEVWAAKPLSDSILEKDATAGIWWIDVENGRPWTEVMEHILRQAELVDVLVFSVHWGPNYREYPSPAFRDFAHALIDHGVRIVHGHSAHHVQPIELYHDGLISYSCGDFLDDYAVDPFFRNDLACILRIHCDPLSTAVTGFDIIPTKIGRLQVSKAALDSERSFVHRRIEGCRIEGLGFSADGESC